MFNHVALRIAASCLAPLIILKPSPAHAAAMQSAAGEQRLDHISVVTLGSTKAKGAPVVLIPGLSSPRAVWDGVAASLARDHLVYLVQVNGFGGDDPGANLKPGMLKGISDDLHVFLTARHSAPVRLAGHSMGGLVGMIFARDHAPDVAKLMIVDSLPYFAVLMAAGGPVPDLATVTPIAARMRDSVAARYGKPVDPATAAASVDSLALKPESRIKMRAWAAAADARVTAEALYEDLTTDMRPDLASLTTPITVVVPWTDASFGKDRTLAFYATQYAQAPKVSFVGIGDAAHFVMLDQPAAFAAALDAFVK